MAMKTKKIFVGFFAILLLLAAIILAVRAVWNYVEGRKLSAAMEKVRASGVALQMKDLVPNCPESENAAIPWKAAWELVSSNKPIRKALQEAIPALFDGRFPQDENRVLLAELLSKNKRIIELMEDAAKRTCFRLNDWSKPAYEAEIGNAAHSLVSMRLLAVDAAFQAENGKIEEALNRCLTGLRLSRLELDEPFLIKGLIAIAETRICLTAARFILNSREIAPETLTAWIKALDPLPLRERFARVIPGERAYSLETGMALLQGNTPSELGLGRFLTWLARPLAKAQIRFMPEVYAGLEKIAKDPYYAQTEYLINHDKRLQEMPYWKWILKLVIPNYQSAFLKEATIESLMLTMRSGLACRLYKLKTGTYPDNLESLVPEFLPEAPLDPFTGKPLVYKLENGLPLIYSLGSNLKDDGGRSTFLIERTVAEKDDDWTWREKLLR